MRLEYETGSSPSERLSLWAVCCGSAAVGCWIMALLLVLGDGLPWVLRIRTVVTRRSGEFVWLAWPGVVALFVVMGIGLLLVGNPRWWMDLLNATRRPGAAGGRFQPGELDQLIAEGEADIERGDVMDLDEAYEQRRAKRALT